MEECKYCGLKVDDGTSICTKCKDILKKTTYKPGMVWIDYKEWDKATRFYGMCINYEKGEEEYYIDNNK